MGANQAKGLSDNVEFIDDSNIWYHLTHFMHWFLFVPHENLNLTTSDMTWID